MTGETPSLIITYVIFEKIMRELVESKNYPEIYNCYAMWIQSNRQYFTTGSSSVKLSDDAVKKPFGFRSYLKTFLTTESEVKSVEQDCSEYLGKYPDQVAKKADIFAKQFPSIIRTKMEKLKQKTKVSNAGLNQFFEQKSMDFTAQSSEMSQTEKIIRYAAEHGAKTIETPEGFKIQF